MTAANFLTFAAECWTRQDWDGVIDNSTKAISAGGTNAEIGKALTFRGSGYALKGNDNLAIIEWKKGADYGSSDAMDALRMSGISYTPQRIPPPPPPPPPPTRTGFPSAFSIGGTSSSYQYEAINHHFIDNGAGDVMLITEVPPGSHQEAYAKFIYDGSSDVMFVRNNAQAIYLPAIPDSVGRLVRNCKVVLIGEKKGYDINFIFGTIKQKKFPENYFSAVYNAPVEIINRPLPISPNDLKAVRARYGLK